MDLSVIIIDWNARDFLRRCLESVYNNQWDARFEVVVVDNASFDGSVQMVREKFPEVRLIENQENLGFARANNQAIEVSSGRYVLLLNPDTEVLPGAPDVLVRFMDEHPLVGAAGAKLLNPGGTLQVSCCPAPTLSRELWRLFHLDALHPYACYPSDRWSMQTPVEVETAQGACLILRREALDQVGYLDEDYFMYSEEVDLCYRLHRVGWKIYWVPRAVVVHHGGQSTRQAARPMFLRLYQGKLLFFRKHYGQLATFLYKLILLFASIARLALVPLAWLEAGQNRERHLSAAGHYRSLVRALPKL